MHAKSIYGRLATVAFFPLLFVLSIFAATATAGAAPAQTQRTELTTQMVRQGVNQNEAKEMVNSLSPADIQVLSENPNMMNNAGADTGEIALGVLIGLLAFLVLIVILAIIF